MGEGLVNHRTSQVFRKGGRRIPLSPKDDSLLRLTFMNTNGLGEVIKERRESKGWSVSQLSRESGVSIAHIARIERGDRFPSGRVLRRLADPLGFSEIELLKLANFMSQDESDDRLDRFKKEIKREIAHALVALYKKVDSL